MAVFGPWPLISPPTIYAPTTGLAIGPKSVEWEMEDVVGVSTNPFNLAQQYFLWQQSLLQCSVSYAFLTNAQHFAMLAWLMELQGASGVFPFGDAYNTQPQDSAATAPSVNGAGQTGYTLAVSGGSHQTPGDWISIQGSGSYSTGSRLYMITSVAGGSLGIWPAIRESPADTQSITISKATGMFRLKGNTRKVTQNVDKTWSVTFEIREAL